MENSQCVEVVKSVKCSSELDIKVKCWCIGEGLVEFAVSHTSMAYFHRYELPGCCERYWGVMYRVQQHCWDGY